MRMRTLLPALTALVAAALPGAARAQVSNGQLVEVARAQLDLIQPDTAAVLLNRVLDNRSNASAGEQLRAWALLGIAELQRGRQQAARYAFRRSLERNPQLMLDSLAYLHSDLRRVFASERESIRLDSDPPVFVGLRLPSDTAIAGSGRLVMDLQPRRRVLVAASITNSRNEQVWSDTVNVNNAGSLEWDLTAGGVPVTPGRYQLRVTATDPAGRTIQPSARTLLLTRMTADTLETPDLEPSELLPDSVPVRPARSILAGAALGAGTLVLASVLGNQELSGDGTGRYVVAATISVAAIVGFLGSRKQRYSPSNATYNQQVVARHNARMMETADENQRRLAAAPMRIRVTIPRGGN